MGDEIPAPSKFVRALQDIRARRLYEPPLKLLGRSFHGIAPLPPIPIRKPSADTILSKDNASITNTTAPQNSHNCCLTILTVVIFVMSLVPFVYFSLAAFGGLLASAASRLTVNHNLHVIGNSVGVNVEQPQAWLEVRC